VPDLFVIATFADGQTLLRAVRAARAENYRIFDAYTPFPVHGLDEAMGIRRTRLPWVTLVAGAFGLVFAAALQFYTSVWDWPLDVGGKPDESALAFVPVAFEITVLVAALSTLGAFLLRARLYPGKAQQPLAGGATEDVFALALRKRDTSDSSAFGPSRPATPAKPAPPFDVSRAREILLACGAREVDVKEAEA
jgi:hypothetical protein